MGCRETAKRGRRSPRMKMTALRSQCGTSSRFAWSWLLFVSTRDVAQPGSAPVWGTGGRRFESGHPDQAPLV